MITATLVPSGTGTEVTVATDLTISGKVAQFGRGVLADVSSKLIDQFVACLDADLLSGATEQEAFMDGLHNSLYIAALIAFAGSLTALLTVRSHARPRPAPETPAVEAA